jgi:hypothetical protein
VLDGRTCPPRGARSSGDPRLPHSPERGSPYRRWGSRGGHLAPRIGQSSTGPTPVPAESGGWPPYHERLVAPRPRTRWLPMTAAARVLPGHYNGGHTIPAHTVWTLLQPGGRGTLCGHGQCSIEHSGYPPDSGPPPADWLRSLPASGRGCGTHLAGGIGCDGHDTPTAGDFVHQARPQRLQTLQHIPRHHGAPSTHWRHGDPGPPRPPQPRGAGSAHSGRRRAAPVQSID